MVIDVLELLGKFSNECALFNVMEYDDIGLRKIMMNCAACSFFIFQFSVSFGS